MSSVLVCEIRDRAAHVYKHSRGHKRLKCWPATFINKIANWRLERHRRRLIHTGSSLTSLSLSLSIR